MKPVKRWARPARRPAPHAHEPQAQPVTALYPAQDAGRDLYVTRVAHDGYGLFDRIGPAPTNINRLQGLLSLQDDAASRLVDKVVFLTHVARQSPGVLRQGLRCAKARTLSQLIWVIPAERGSACS